MIPLNDELIETVHLDDGLRLDRYASSIHEYSLNSVSRHIIDLWAKSLKDRSSKMTDGDTMFELHDFKDSKVSTVTPYLRQTVPQLIHDVNQMLPHSHSVIAIVVTKNVYSFVFRLFVDSLRFLPKTEIKLFFERAEAQQWLRSRWAAHHLPKKN